MGPAVPAIAANWATNPGLDVGATAHHNSFWGYVAPLIWGTLFVSAIALLLGAPVAIGIALVPQWEGLCITLDLPHLILDERFQTNGDRFDNADALNDELGPAMAEIEADAD